MTYYKIDDEVTIKVNNADDEHINISYYFKGKRLFDMIEYYYDYKGTPTFLHYANDGKKNIQVWDLEDLNECAEEGLTEHYEHVIKAFEICWGFLDFNIHNAELEYSIIPVEELNLDENFGPQDLINIQKAVLKRKWIEEKKRSPEGYYVEGFLYKTNKDGYDSISFSMTEFSKNDIEKLWGS